MNKIQRWFFMRMLRKLITQSSNHRENIYNLYRDIANTSRQEFTEDDKPTLDGFLKDLHMESLNGDDMYISLREHKHRLTTKNI